MRLSVESAPQSVRAPTTVEVGSVYKVQGGRGGPRFRVIVAVTGSSTSVTGQTCISLVFDESGEIVGLDRSGGHYLVRKRVVGRLREPLPILDVEWFEESGVD